MIFLNKRQVTILVITIGLCCGFLIEMRMLRRHMLFDILTMLAPQTTSIIHNTSKKHFQQT